MEPWDPDTAEDDGEAGEPAEPFATVSLARLLAKQGAKQRAAEICREVLARQPGDERAQRLLRELSSGEDRDPRAARPVRAEESQELAASSEESSVLLLARSPEVVVVLWESGSGPEERAAALAGPGATRVLRLFSTWRGTAGVETRTRDLPAEGRTGHRAIEGCRPGAVHSAALGWLDPSRGIFIPTAHSETARTPAAGPSPRRRALWARPPAVERRSEGGEPAVELVARWRAQVGEGSLWGDDSEEDVPMPAPPPEAAGTRVRMDRGISSWGLG